MFIIKSIFFIIIIFFITSCTEKYKTLEHISKGNFKEVSWSEIDGFKEDNLQIALEVFKKDCKRSYKNINLKKVCTLAEDSYNGKKFFKQNFNPYTIIDNNGGDTGLITGYYEPLLYGSLTKTKKYRYPVYKTPYDLVKKRGLRGKIVNNKFIPYDTREEIEKRDDLEPICFVDDKIDLFFLQIQGSGKVQLENGDMLNLGYSNQNGRKYYPIGRKLIQNGEIKRKDISLQSIKKWLRKNPSKIDKILNLNKSYVFFHNSKKGATGALGVELVANRNLAVDKSIIPLGFPVFINTTNPKTKKEINQLMVAGDVGGAIKGQIRADFFFGFGNSAEELAGIMKERGKLFLLIPK